jgi:translation elongation factor EF-Ts
MRIRASWSRPRHADRCYEPGVGEPRRRGSENYRKEIEIGKELARNEGKAEDMLEKIAMGRLNKFFQESTLLSQKFVKNNDQTVDQYLRSLTKTLR